MKGVSYQYKYGFTLIEVLISVIIVSIITMISTNILQSSLSSRELTFNNLDGIKQYNLASSIIRRDLRQAVNVPMRSFYGEDYNATFLSLEDSNTFTFISLVESGTNESSSIKRIEYIVENGVFFRKQYFSDNPYLNEDYFQSILFEGIDEFNLSFSDGISWFKFWPKDPFSSRKIPQLVRINLESKDNSIEWIVSPQIQNVYQQ